MQLIPIDEAIREIHMRDAQEERTDQIARKMLAKGVSLEDIRKYTGLEREEILALR